MRNMSAVKFSIDYRNMNTGIHGILVFENRKSAEENLDLLRQLDSIETNEEYVLQVERVWQNAIAVAEEVDYREIYSSIRELRATGLSGTEIYDVKVINYGSTIDVYL